MQRRDRAPCHGAKNRKVELVNMEVDDVKVVCLFSHAVGYFFIILYSIFFCGCLLGAFIPVILMVTWRETGPRIALLMIAVLCAAVAASMVFHYRRALFYFHATPNQAMQSTAVHQTT